MPLSGELSEVEFLVDKSLDLAGLMLVSSYLIAKPTVGFDPLASPRGKGHHHRQPIAATLGLIDVAYVSPQLARNDFRDRWGSDDYSCLSRYDGLKYFRINALGAWCLGQTQHYQPEEIITRRTWRVLPNHDVVSSELHPNPVDVMFLDKFADRTSDLVWRLDREKVLTAVESGLAIDAIVAFLEEHSAEPIPPTVGMLVGDLRDGASRLRDKGTVRMIQCGDPETARLLLLDPKLKTLCLPAGERNLVFRTADETKVRTQLRKLGYIMASGERDGRLRWELPRNKSIGTLGPGL